jgi:hypothetical protein
VLKDILAKEFTDDSAHSYMEQYWAWKKLSIEEKDKEIIKKAEEEKKKLAELEESYSYEKIGKLREVAHQKHKIEIRKDLEKIEYEKKIEEFKASKGDGMKGWIGFGKSDEEK